ncbi:aldehyde dehydrogenase family protein, partial [bacterium]
RHEVPAGIDAKPVGIVVVTPPWNFPYAIPCGGVLAALMAGNSVIFKPAPETAQTAYLLAKQLWAAGIPEDVLQFYPCDDGEVGTSLISDPRVGAIILTGSLETARFFQKTRPTMRLFAETSGKNATVITAQADREAAIKDLVKSAFFHAGQKCSASSLAIVEAEVYDSPDFRRQLRDCAASLFVGPSTDARSVITPTVQAPSPALERALTKLEPGEEWLLKPKQIGDDPCSWTPGIKLGVKEGSWFHQTECFGPVLGLMRANSLSHAIKLQNGTRFGLTAGLHTLDPRQIAIWRDKVEAGNLYINRGTTGAVVQRQPFGGWKASSVGPGSKAGGPNYVWSFLTLTDAVDSQVLFTSSYTEAWDNYFSKGHDPSKLRCESNVFRYRPCKGVVLRLKTRDEAIISKAELASKLTGASLTISIESEESDADFAARLPALIQNADRLRTVDVPADEVLHAANESGFNWIDAPFTSNGRLELRFWLREQAVTQTRHRYGQISEFQPDSRRGL